MKYEWRKKDKELYLPKKEPGIIVVPPMQFIMLAGKGNPNSEGFSEVIGVLYTLSYAIKMLPKKGTTPEGYFEYTVFPLEGIWDLADEAKGLETLDKDSLIYTLMIRQPNFVTSEIVKEVIENLKRKKPHPFLDRVEFKTEEEGKCVQMLHQGSYDSEPKTFKTMEEFCLPNNLERVSKKHREIYLSDARKIPPEKLKTVLRFKVKEIG